MERKSRLAGFKRPPLPKHVKELPDIAWPTIILAVVCSSIMALFHYGYIYREWSYWMCLAVWSVCDYCLFTVMHDAVHYAIATHKSGYHWLNDWFGRLAITPHMGNIFIFRMVHLTHHKFTNIEGLDPDFYTLTVPRFFKENPLCQALLSDWRPIILPLKWFTISPHWIYFYLSRELYQFQPWSEIIESIVQMLVWHGFSFYLYFVHGNSYMFDTFYCAESIAAVALAFAFDYLPHRNVHTTEPYIASTMVSLMKSSESKLKPSQRSVQSIDAPMENTQAEKEECDPWPLKMMGVLCQNQNYHTMHHVYPSIPWYRYPLTWEVYSEYFKHCGAEVQSCWPLFRPVITKED